MAVKHIIDVIDVKEFKTFRKFFRISKQNIKYFHTVEVFDPGSSGAPIHKFLSQLVLENI